MLWLFLEVQQIPYTYLIIFFHLLSGVFQGDYRLLFYTIVIQVLSGKELYLRMRDVGIWYCAPRFFIF